MAVRVVEGIPEQADVRVLQRAENLISTRGPRVSERRERRAGAALEEPKGTKAGGHTGFKSPSLKPSSAILPPSSPSALPYMSTTTTNLTPVLVSQP